MTPLDRAPRTGRGMTRRRSGDTVVPGRRRALAPPPMYEAWAPALIHPRPGRPTVLLARRCRARGKLDRCDSQDREQENDDPASKKECRKPLSQP